MDVWLLAALANAGANACPRENVSDDWLPRVAKSMIFIVAAIIVTQFVVSAVCDVYI